MGVRLWFILGLLYGVHNTGYALTPLDPNALFPGVSNSLQPSSRWLTNQKPLPTNAWYINFVLGQEGNKPSEPVNISPYLARISSEGISLSYKGPAFYAEPEYPAVISAIFYPFEPQITIGATETLPQYGLASVEEQAITLQWSNDNIPLIKAPIVQGSPYLSLFYHGVRPQLSTPFRWLFVNNQFIPGQVTEATRFKIVLALNEQQTQTWILYTEKPVEFVWLSTASGDRLQASQPYSGWMRLALLDDEPTHLKNDSILLDNYSSTIPLGYQKSYDGQGYKLQWKTQNNQAPLMLTLPHQRSNYYPLRSPGLTYSGIKGLMTAATDAQWTMPLPLPSIQFLEEKKLTNQQITILKEALKQDTNELFSWPFPDDGPYRSGKRLARIARLALIADKINEQDIKKQLLDFMKNYLFTKMTTEKNWYFQYDNTWGGIIPSVDDYGARHYNDHHYHYGYWVYAFAVIAHFDSVWIKTPVKDRDFTPAQWIEALIRDYANPSSNDSWFPAQRHQDDYAGHSWASGLKAYTDGQNQQSSSEAVNAYYALALYGLATQNSELMAFGEFLTAREIHSAQVYWQVQKDSPVYPLVFRKNNWVVANLWGSKVDSNAFFDHCKKAYRCGLEFSFGIEMLPFNGISKDLLNQQWLRQASPVIKKIINNEYGPIPDSWRWILIKGISSVLSKDELTFYFNKAVDSKPEAYDNGDSKTNTLYFLIL